ncbi:DUF5642 family protein [Mycobacterium sp. PSTR-4-N]|uniref:DUF5642 family protein n=1 Tax=Mycobacterium sp. PSTR-4-N TaxID=2917745 RepID=UPI001F14AA3D|nr:DUF5642 family protein [Mycobacterium sp. PSTR-4-N]MCG7593019.1 DUF5642 family protein [Mycobacterium sp. PSTR-4-N]
MSYSKSVTLLLCAGLLASCGGQSSDDDSRADITRVKDLRSEFPAPFTVSDAGPAAIDPRLLAGQKLPAGLTFAPAECGKVAQQQNVPADVKGNMAALTAEGEGVRYVVIAVETSEPVPVPAPTDQCRKVSLAGPGIRGLVEVVDAPDVDGVQAVGTHRVLQTVTAEGPRTGELYNYVAHFGTFIVIVTANPLVVADRPVARIDTGRARDLVTKAVELVKG